MAKARSRSKAVFGPKLPSALSKEMGTTLAEGLQPKGKRGTSMFLVSQRKEARKAKRKAKGRQQYQQQRGAVKGPQIRGAQQEAPSARPMKKPRMAPVALIRASEHPAQDSARPASQQQRPKSKFTELLQEDVLKGTDLGAIKAEADFQRQLAKKLAPKSKAKVKKSAAEAAEETASELEDDSGEGSLSSDSSEDGSSEGGGGEDGLAELAGGWDSQEDTMGVGSDDDKSGESKEMLHSEEDSGANELSSGDAVGASSSEDGASDEEDEDSEAPASLRQAGQAEFSGRPAEPGAKYVPPAARRVARGADDGEIRLRRRLTGLINRLSDPNLAQVAGEVLSLLDIAARKVVADIVTELILQAAEGPRASDRFAAVAAAFVASLSGRAGAPDIGANFAAALAARLEAAYAEDDSLSCGNLAGVFAQMYLTGLLPAGCVYSLLEHLRGRFEEQDVALLHQLLKLCGFRLRSDDPEAMKDLVMGMHARAAEKKGSMSNRTEVMLELVLDIKNNRQPKGGGAISTEALLGQGSLRWLRESRVAEGMWWLPAAGEDTGLPSAGKAALLSNAEWGSELLQLAAKQRMNTDVRRAIFCVIMGSDDCVDASERLLHLPLKGESQREIVRVAVECCLQEAHWNPYYGALLERVLQSARAHQVTMQYCIWDHLKQLASEDARRATHLARLAAHLIQAKALPIIALRGGSFDNIIEIPQEDQFWHTFFLAFMLGSKEDAQMLAVFKGMAGQKQLQSFAAGMQGYLRDRFDAQILATLEADRAETLLKKSKLLQKTLRQMAVEV